MVGNSESGNCAVERRQNLMKEFQSFLECMDRPAPNQMMNNPCPDKAQIICMPKQDQGSSSSGNPKADFLNRMRDEASKLPHITACGTIEYRPTDQLSKVEGENSANVKYMQSEDFVEMKKKRAEKNNDAPKQQGRMMCFTQCPDPCRPGTSPLSKVKYVVCAENKEEEMFQSNRPKSPPPPDTSLELRGGIFYANCECKKRNGLQQDCPLTMCRGQPPCLVKPVPDCIPSGGTGRFGCPPKISNYPYRYPECPPKEKMVITTYDSHRAEVDCPQCKPTLMCRPICEEDNKPKTAARGRCP